MRVGVFLDDIRPEAGGGFTFVHDVVDAFKTIAHQSHHEFVLYCPPDYARHLATQTLPDNVRVAAIAPRGTIGRMISGIRHYLPISGFALRKPGALERHARRDGVQVMWFVGGFHDTLDIPYVSTVWDLQHRTHPWFPEVSANWLWDHRELVISRHLQRAARVITGTEVGRRQIEKFYGVPNENVRIIPHPTPGFALRAAASPTSERTPPNGPFMFYPAQFWAHKNHINLLLAWRELLKKTTNPPTLVFVGSDKGNKGFVESKIQELGLNDHVQIYGFVTRETLVALYRHAEALVYGSFSGPENLPPLEAFALGCPVIASDFPGVREQLSDAALYFDPHDPNSICAAIWRFLHEPSVRTELLARGQTRAVRQTGETFVRSIFELFDEFETERRCWA